MILEPTYTDEDHRYTDPAGNVISSVTQIIGDYWPIDRRFYAASGTRRGSDVHTVTAMMDRGGLTATEAAVGDESQVGYLKGWEQYRRDTHYVADWVEQPFICDELDYAGTVDRLFRAGPDYHVVDIKTGAPESWHELQQGAYALAAIFAGYNVTSISSVYLRESGSYRIEVNNLDRAVAAWKHLIGWRRYREEMRRR